MPSIIAPAHHVAQRSITRAWRARKLDIFGAPTFTAGADIFWGDDRWRRRLPLRH